MRSTSIRIAVVSSLMIACGGGARTGATAEDPNSRGAAEHAGKVSGPGAGAAATDCSDWRSWTKVNKERFLSEGHGGKWVDVYVEAQYADAYMKAASPAPAGMRVIKAGYKDQAGTKFEALTVMGKMPAGYDAEHGDWYYGVLTEDGVTAKMQGKLEMCIDCHSQASDRDYLFGTEGH
jgi:hypothetical protein